MDTKAKIIKYGNIKPPRRGGYSDPEEGRVHSPLGIAPCVKSQASGGAYGGLFILPIYIISSHAKRD